MAGNQAGKAEKQVVKRYCPALTCGKVYPTTAQCRFYCDCGRECVDEKAAREIRNKAVQSSDVEDK